MSLLLLRHALSITDADGNGDGDGGPDDDAFTFFSVSRLDICLHYSNFWIVLIMILKCAD